VKADAIIRRFMPRQGRFQELVAQDTENLLRAARLFSEIAQSASLEDRRVRAVQLKSIEHEGDKITRQIFEALNSTFITPLDREDIRAIASDLDDILDYLEAVGHALVLFELADAPAGLRHFAQIIVSMVEEIDKATGLVWNLVHEARIQESIVRISELENQGDALYSTVIAGLFKDGRDPIEVLKWKEVYDSLEDACDGCKDYTHILGNVVIKNA